MSGRASGRMTFRITWWVVIGNQEDKADHKAAREAKPPMGRYHLGGDGSGVFLTQQIPAEHDEQPVNRAGDGGDARTLFPRAVGTERVGGVDESVGHGVDRIHRVEDHEGDGSEER